MEKFTPEEQRILSQFVTNIDKPVFGLVNLPESIKGALFSRYSRTPKSLRRLLLDEFILDKESGFQDMVQLETKTGMTLTSAVKKAEAFFDRVLDGYGDDSVGELGGAHLACEQVSNIAVKVLEDARLGGSPLEKSTRYVAFDQKGEDGDYLFYKEPKIMESTFEKEYLESNRNLFELYSDMFAPMSAHIKQNAPLENYQFKDPLTQQLVAFTDLKDEATIKRAQRAYETSVKAKTCDVIRYLLPAATLTNVGIFGNGRFFQNLLSKMYSDPLTEMQLLAKSMHEELNHTVLSFVKRAKADEYAMKTNREMNQLTQELLQNDKPMESNAVTLVDYDNQAEEKVLALMLYQYSQLPLAQLRQKVKRLPHEEKIKIIQTYVNKRRHRRDKPARAMEQSYYEFDILGDYGAYRDLQRHRVLTQIRQDLTVAHGYETPVEIMDVGMKREYDYAMHHSAEVYHTIYRRMPKESQYVVPFAYRIRWMMKLNLREAFHFLELRSGIAGHPSYRTIAQKMFYQMENVHPFLVQYMHFMDLTPGMWSQNVTFPQKSNLHTLGRMQSEVRKEEKRDAREQQVVPNPPRPPAGAN